jgi:hypothetical protein
MSDIKFEFEPWKLMQAIVLAQNGITELTKLKRRKAALATV